jgi:hypothetical protein
MAFFCRMENISSFLIKLVQSCCERESECTPCNDVGATNARDTTFWRRAAVILRILQQYDKDAVQICAELYSVVMKEMSEQANITSFATNLIFWTIEQVGVDADPYIRCLKDVPEDWCKELGDKFWAELWWKDSGLTSSFLHLSFKQAFMRWTEDKTVYVLDTMTIGRTPAFWDALLHDGLIKITSRTPDGLELHRYRSLAWITAGSARTESSLIKLDVDSPPTRLERLMALSAKKKNNRSR